MGTSVFMGTSVQIYAAVWMYLCNKTTQLSPTAAQNQETKQENTKHISNIHYLLLYKITLHLLRHILLNQ